MAGIPQFNRPSNVPQLVPDIVNEELPEITSSAVLDASTGRRTRRRSRTQLGVAVADLDLPQSGTLHEALTCIQVGLYPQAHVTAWNALMELVFTKLARPPGQGAWVPEHLILESLVTLGLCDADEHEWLIALLQRRNECAHATTFKPTEAESLWYLDVILEHMALIASREVAQSA